MVVQPRTHRTYHKTYTKDPDAVMPYTINWEPYIQHGDTITSATSTAYVDGLSTTTTAITVASTSTTGLTTTTVLSGGVSDANYDIKVHVVTTNGYEDERTIRVRVRQK